MPFQKVVCIGFLPIWKTQVMIILQQMWDRVAAIITMQAVPMPLLDSILKAAAFMVVKAEAVFRFIGIIQGRVRNAIPTTRHLIFAIITRIAVVIVFPGNSLDETFYKE